MANKERKIRNDDDQAPTGTIFCGRTFVQKKTKRPMVPAVKYLKDGDIKVHWSYGWVSLAIWHDGAWRKLACRDGLGVPAQFGQDIAVAIGLTSDIAARIRQLASEKPPRKATWKAGTYFFPCNEEELAERQKKREENDFGAHSTAGAGKPPAARLQRQIPDEGGTTQQPAAPPKQVAVTPKPAVVTPKPAVAKQKAAAAAQPELDLQTGPPKGTVEQARVTVEVSVKVHQPAPFELTGAPVEKKKKKKTPGKKKGATAAKKATPKKKGGDGDDQQKLF